MNFNWANWGNHQTVSIAELKTQFLSRNHQSLRNSEYGSQMARRDSQAAGDNKLQNYHLKNNHSKIDLAHMAKLQKKRLSTQRLNPKPRSMVKRFLTIDSDMPDGQIRRLCKQPKCLQSMRVSLTDLNEPPE